MTERVRLTDQASKLTRVRIRERLDEDGGAQPAKRKKAKRRLLRMTEANVAALRIDKAGSYLVWDHGTDAQRGLAVMVLPSGAKSFYCYYNFPKQPSKSMALGRVGEMLLEEARRRTGEARGKAKDGIDPRADDPRRSLTFTELVNVWHEREQVGRKANVSADATKRFVEFHCKTRFGNRPAGTIRYEEIDDLLTVLRDARKQGATANRLHSHLASIFKWSVTTRRLAASPMLGMPMPWGGAKPREREWFAGEAADRVIKGLWHVAGELGGDPERFLKLAILTGKRRNIIQSMRWEMIDADWYWQPPKGSKSKRNNPIPLPKLARRVLGNKQDAGAAIAIAETAAQDLMLTVRKKLELPDYFHHGLRHLFETRTGELGVLPHIRDLLLDHAIARSASGRGYDHGAYKAQLLEALELWAGHVANLVAPGKDVAVLR